MSSSSLQSQIEARRELRLVQVESRTDPQTIAEMSGSVSIRGSLERHQGTRVIGRRLEKNYVCGNRDNSWKEKTIVRRMTLWYSQGDRAITPFGSVSERGYDWRVVALSGLAAITSQRTACTGEPRRRAAST